MDLTSFDKMIRTNSIVRNIVTAIIQGKTVALCRENQMLKLQLFQAKVKLDSMSSESTSSIKCRDFLHKDLILVQTALAKSNSNFSCIRGLIVFAIDVVIDNNNDD